MSALTPDQLANQDDRKRGLELPRPRADSANVPQADNLDDVARTVDAVASGATSFQDIAASIGKVDRQGRYYRLAAETMDLITNAVNHAELTPYGEALSRATGDDRIELLRLAVLRNPTARTVLNVIRNAGEGGLSRAEFIAAVAMGGAVTGETPRRRASTVRAWLVDCGFVQEAGGRFVSRGIPPDAAIQERDDLGFPNQPLVGLTAGPAPAVPTQGTPGAPIMFTVDAVKRERAELVHARLISKMAANVERAGGIPTQNLYVDLATNLAGEPFLFEMKSASPGNFHAQLRRGVSQLYEYAYIQRLQNPVLCLVTEIPPPPGKQWLANYLKSDRQIDLCWEATTGSANFDCNEESRATMGPLL